MYLGKMRILTLNSSLFSNPRHRDPKWALFELNLSSLFINVQYNAFLVI